MYIPHTYVNTGWRNVFKRVHDSKSPSVCEREVRKLGDNSTDDDGANIECRDYETPEACEVLEERRRRDI